MWNSRILGRFAPDWEQLTVEHTRMQALKRGLPGDDRRQDLCCTACGSLFQTAADVSG